MPFGHSLSAAFEHTRADAIIKRNDMGKYEKLLFQILRGTSDANIAFDDLRQLLLRLGFEERRRGSHHTFRKERIEEKSTCNGMTAKPRIIRDAKCGQ